MERTIHVTGKAKLSVRPDTTRLYITVSGERQNYSDALAANKSETEKVKDLLEQFDFDRKELKTARFRVDANFESYQDQKTKRWKQEFKGYTYEHRMHVDFPIDNLRLGKVLFALSNAEYKPEFSIDYRVADPEDARNELLALAVRDSKKKAEILTEAAGAQLIEVLNIDYSWGKIELYTRPIECLSMDYSEPASASASELDIDPDDIDLEDTVTSPGALPDH